MHKPFIIGICAGFVLLSGLLSCSPEKKVTDVYQAAAPIVHHGGEHLQLRNWDEKRSKQWELQDSFDFSASHPSRILIRSRCRRGEDHLNSEYSFSGVPTIQIWQILPEDALTQQLQATECAFELNLYNEAGSNHIFNVASTQVVENLPAQVRIAHEPDAGPKRPLTLSVDQMQDVRIRYSNHAPAAAEISCFDVTLKALPFEQVAGLALFDFNAVEIRPGRRSETLAERPVQYCRAFISEAGRRVAMSDGFQIVLPHQPLRFEQGSTLNRSGAGNEVLGPLYALAAGQSIEISQWKITNTEKFRRFIRLPVRKFALSASGTVSYRTSIGKFVAPSAGVKLYPASASSQVILQDANQITLAIDPGQNLVVSGRFYAAQRFNCQAKITTLTINFTEPINVEEVAGDGTLLANWKLPIIQPVQLLSRSLSAETIPVVTCDWR